MASRYDNLNTAISATVVDSKSNKPYRIIEIGVHHAARSVMMVKLARKLGRTNIEYYGFDLFEDMTPNFNSNEFGKQELAVSRDEARRRIIAAGATKVQLIKGDTKFSMPQAIKDIPVANVVFIDGGHSIETIASDLENVLNCCGPNTRVILDDCYPSNYDKGCAFLSKCFTMLKEYGISLEELSPLDTVGADNLNIRVMSLRCAAQLTPSSLLGFGQKLLIEAGLAPVEPEPQEFIPQATFVDDAPTANVDVDNESKSVKEAGDESGTTFQPDNSCRDTDVQSVRVCENSCGELPGEHCERTNYTCGRREPEVESFYVDNVPSQQVDNLSVPEERQEFDTVVEPGNPLGLGEPCSSDNSGELRPEVSPELEQGTSRSSKRRRRRSGPSDERSGSQS
jgi:hypothetical protein